jgi:cobalt/nickel transport system permease protein
VKHNFIDRYAGLDSPLHQLDARTKILGFVALIVVVLTIPADARGVFAALFMLAAMLLGVSQVPLQYVLQRTLALLPFLLLAGIGARWSSLGATLFAAFLMRALLCLILLILLTNTTPFAALLRGLRQLGCPRVLTLNLGFLYRYLFVLTDEALRMRQARECRRVRRASVLAELRLLGSMLGTLLVRSFERAERMYQAMLSRGFEWEFPVAVERRFGVADVAFLAGTAAVVTAAWIVAHRT